MEKILDIFTKKEFYLFIGSILIAIIIYQILKAIINKTKTTNKRQVTIKNLLLQIIKIVLIIIVVLICMSLIGINVTSFIAGLGIAGVVVGLALQDIMKDVLAGVFIIFEDQYDVGDLVEINNFTGEVIKLGVKTTRLKNYEGKIKIISNRNISEVINYSKSNNISILDIPVPYEENIEKIEKVLAKITMRIDKELMVAKKPSEILGINNFADSAIIYRIMVEVKPGESIPAQRIIRKIVKQEFDKNNISIPYNKLEVINGK